MGLHNSQQDLAMNPKRSDWADHVDVVSVQVRPMIHQEFDDSQVVVFRSQKKWSLFITADHYRVNMTYVMWWPAKEDDMVTKLMAF